MAEPDLYGVTDPGEASAGMPPPPASPPAAAAPQPFSVEPSVDPYFSALAANVLPRPASLRSPANLNVPRGLPGIPSLPSIGGMPAPPQKIPVPEPPKPEYRDPLLALGRPLSLLALVASSFARNPAIAAGNAMAAAIDAQKKGDQTNYQNAYKEYEQQFRKAIEEQRKENDEYQAAWQNRKLSFDEKIAQLKMAALKRKDHTLLDAINTGDIDNLIKVKADVNAKASDGFEKAQAQNKEVLSGGLPGMDLHPEVLGKLPPATAALVKAMGEYRFPVQNFRNKQMQALLPYVMAYNPSFNALDYAGRAKTVADFTGGKAAQTITSINTLIGHLRSLHEAASELNNTRFPSLNAPLNFLMKQTGDPRIKRFREIAQEVVAEASRAFKGTVTEGDIKRRIEEMDSASSPAQLQASITAITELLESRIQALGDQYDRGTGTAASGMELIPPKTREALQYINEVPVGRHVPSPSEGKKKTLGEIWGTQ